METITHRKPHAVVVASPGMGHLTPFIELVNNLVSHHDFEITFFAVISDSSSIQSQTISSAINSNFLHVHVLQPDVSPPVLPITPDSVTIRLVEIMKKAMPHVRSTIFNMKVSPDLLIADVFGLEGYWDVADEFGMSKYAFLTSSAWFLALTVYLPHVEQDAAKEEVEGTNYIYIRGCEPYTKNDKMLPLTSDNPNYFGYVGVAKRLSMSDGIIVNSWVDLEPKAIKSLNDPNLLGQVMNCQVFAVGPLVKKVAPTENQVLKWMDKQPDESVMYVSFGSGGSLTHDQIHELAWGLELSQQRFVWVSRPPSDKDASSDFFFSIDIADESHIALDFLPTGFLSRTKEVGLVVPMWAPQAEILAHKAIGGFLTHCGWNSIIESVINGVPMVAWPLYVEQGMNAKMLTEHLKIAVKPDASSVGEELIYREEIEKAIRMIMTDKSRYVLKERVMKIKTGAIAAVEADKGSSSKSFSEFSKLCTTKMK